MSDILEQIKLHQPFDKDSVEIEDMGHDGKYYL